MTLKELNSDDVISFTFSDNIKAISVVSGIEDYDIVAFSEDLWCSSNDHMSIGRSSLLMSDVQDFVYLGKLGTLRTTHPELFI